MSDIVFDCVSDREWFVKFRMSEADEPAGFIYDTCTTTDYEDFAIALAVNEAQRLARKRENWFWTHACGTRKNGRPRSLDDAICPVCKKIFRRKYKKTIFCGVPCALIGRKPKAKKVICNHESA